MSVHRGVVRLALGVVALAATMSSLAGIADAAPLQQTGSGTNESPFVKPCVQSDETNCTVEFSPRPLDGFWSGEYVPAYQCPVDHPYLAKAIDYAPFGTSVPRGVEVVGLGPIGVSITASAETRYAGEGLFYKTYKTGTLTGLGNSSATHWSVGKHEYQIKLHCSNNLEENSYTRVPREYLMN